MTPLDRLELGISTHCAVSTLTMCRGSLISVHGVQDRTHSQLTNVSSTSASPTSHAISAPAGAEASFLHPEVQPSSMTSSHGRSMPAGISLEPDQLLQTPIAVCTLARGAHGMPAFGKGWLDKHLASSNTSRTSSCWLSSTADSCQAIQEGAAIRSQAAASHSVRAALRSPPSAPSATGPPAAASTEVS